MPEYEGNLDFYKTFWYWNDEAYPDLQAKWQLIWNAHADAGMKAVRDKLGPNTNYLDKGAREIFESVPREDLDRMLEDKDAFIKDFNERMKARRSWTIRLKVDSFNENNQS